MLISNLITQGMNSTNIIISEILMGCSNKFILFNFTCHAGLSYSLVSEGLHQSLNVPTESLIERSLVDDNLMSKQFNFQYSHCLTVFLAEAVCFSDLSHFQQSFHQLLVGWIGGDPEPCFKHLPPAGSEIPWIVLLNHLQLCIFHPQLQA